MTEAMMNDFTDVAPTDGDECRLPNDFTDITPEDQDDPISREMESSRSQPGHLLSHRSQQVTRKDRMLLASGCWTHLA